MGQKHKRFRESRMPFPLGDIRKKSSQDVRACAAGDGAISSKNRKIVPYHGVNPNTGNGARLRSPSPIMAPDKTRWSFQNTREMLKTRAVGECFLHFYIIVFSTFESSQITGV